MRQEGWMGLISGPLFIKNRKFLSVVIYKVECLCLGYWHQRADETHGNPPQGNQEQLVVRGKVGRPPGELGLSKSMECVYSLQCFDTVGWATGRASGLYKRLGAGLLVVMI